MTRHIDAKIESIRSFARFCEGRGHPGHPLEVFLEISNVCDLKCAMCTEFSAINPLRFSTLKRHERGFLRAEEVEGPMSDVLRGALLVHCSGYGEPTVNPDFRDFISFVSGYETLIGFITNGMHLDATLSEFLVEKKVFRIMVSLSGSRKEDYESIYIRGRYERVLEGIREVARAKRRRGRSYPIIEINSLGFRQHVDAFDRFVETMAEAGANVVHLKKLQPYPHIPELYEHVSIHRPWVEGRILDRAIEIGRRAGVQVACDQYVADGVTTEAEYDARMAELRRSAEQRLTGRPFGANPASDFVRIGRTIVQEPSPDGPAPEAIVPLDAAPETARSMLQIGPLSELEEHSFHCMEPFKTLYVRKNGTVKPCCFGADQPWLGSIREDDGTSIWRGAGFTELRDGILRSEYPRTYCGRCVREKIGPSDHFAFELVNAFVDWYAESHSPELDRRLQEVAPEVYALLLSSPASKIAENHRVPAPAAGDVAAARSVPRVPEDTRPEGWLERVEGDRAFGWAWLPQRPDERPTVRVYRGADRIAQGVACRPREDLVAAGKGDGCYGFSILLPADGRPWRRDDLRLTLRVGRGELPLPGG